MLSCDAFSMGKHLVDSVVKKINEDCRQATRVLFEEVPPLLPLLLPFLPSLSTAVLLVEASYLLS